MSKLSFHTYNPFLLQPGFPEANSIIHCRFSSISHFSKLSQLSFSNFRIFKYFLDKQIHSQLPTIMKLIEIFWRPIQDRYRLISDHRQNLVRLLCSSYLYLFWTQVPHPLFSRSQLVTHWILYEGVRKQFAALREGFESFFPISSLNLFYADEVIIFKCFDKNVIKLF